MLFKSAALLALGASAAVASPLVRIKRQETTAASSAAETSAASAESTAESTVTGSAAQSTATTSVEATATSADATGLSSAISQASEVSGSAAPEPTGTSTNGTSEELAFGCPTGYSLTYVIGSSIYPDVEIAQANQALANWGEAIPPPIMSINSTGSEVGATRSWEVMNLTVSETLTNVTEREDGGLQQSWNLSEPIDVSEAVIIANATSDLTLFTNTTTNDTSVQFYVNFCVNDQPTGLTLYAELVTAYLTGLNELFAGGENSTTGGATSAASSMMTSSSEPTSSAAATDSASSALGTATSGAGSVVSEGVSGATSVASEAVGGVTGVVGDATSAVGSAVASLIPTRRV